MRAEAFEPLFRSQSNVDRFRDDQSSLEQERLHSCTSLGSDRILLAAIAAARSRGAAGRLEGLTPPAGSLSRGGNDSRVDRRDQLLQRTTREVDAARRRGGEDRGYHREALRGARRTDQGQPGELLELRANGQTQLAGQSPSIAANVERRRAGGASQRARRQSGSVEHDHRSAYSCQ